MVESVNFDYKKFIDKSKKLEDKINLKDSKNVKNQRELLISPLYAGFVITGMFGIPIYLK